MAELKGLNIATHLDCIFKEFKSQESIYGYPRRKMYLGFPGFDLGVLFHGRRAETLLGPASGPHSQMAQNIVLAFLGGSRIIELKTVQILDQLDIARPCIDIRNVGYNVEWSQELRLADSFNEYVTAWVLLKLIEESEILGIKKGAPFYDTIFDISVGYDLKGIRSPQMNKWLKDFKNTTPAITEILQSLPPEYEEFKKLAIDSNISNSVTLSTFHGCPADEIESMVEHLIAEHGFHVVVKMNPTILGYQAVDNILHEKLGYQHIELDPKAFDHDISFQEAVNMMKRLQSFALKHDKKVGAKFTNTLVVKNNREIFKKDDLMYLSGAPLHVLAMTALNQFRSALGEDFLISFSAGINKHNFVDAVLCNLTPVTSCTDLLKEGGYTRLFQYLSRLQNAMEKENCSTIDAFIQAKNNKDTVASAGHFYTAGYVEAIISDPMYHIEKNKKTPPKIDSHLKLFDCITCNKCLPVCPNASNFSINTGVVEWPVLKISISDGKFISKSAGLFKLSKKEQIANLADFCNECGDCDTYCPEYGGPFIEKPRFFSSEETFNRFADYDGFYCPESDSMFGRIAGQEWRLVFYEEENKYSWENRSIRLHFNSNNDFLNGEILADNSNKDEIDTESYYIMRVLFDGLKNSQNNYASIILGM
jgi:putative selenate reductase